MVDNIIVITFIVIVGYFAFVAFIVSEEEKNKKREKDEDRK